MNAVLKELSALGVHEKLQLVEDLWDSIDQDSIPVMNDDLYAELQRRVAWSKANPGHDVTIEELAATLGVRL
ncbi:MAG: addiction module protein [Burkholderiaceae bacterium]|nr:addiction module protein [Burkholderiaceae bacterium]